MNANSKPDLSNAQIILTTERLILRAMTLKDIDNLQLIFNDPIAMQYYPHTLNRKDTKQWIQRTLADYQESGMGLWACHLKSNHEFVGQCGLIYRDDVDSRAEHEVGYLFVRQHWNHGYATEAAKACMSYGHQLFGLNRVISLIRPENERSRRVAVKNEMIAEKEIEFFGNIHIVYSRQLG